MAYGNVLVLGNAGVGKSTLINAVLGENVAETGWGTDGTTEKLEIYESKEVSFRIIDSVGFVPSPLKKAISINAVKRWSKEVAKNGDEDGSINAIWFCVDGTSSKLFPETIKSLTSAVGMWESVPIIAVITKAYSEPDREKNIALVKQAFGEQKKKLPLVDIIPVVAETYALNSEAYAPPYGVDTLIEKTNELIPSGKQSAKNDIDRFVLNRKRALAQSLITSCTAGAVVVGAVPIPFSDAVILTAIETGMFVGIRKVYALPDDDDFSRIQKAFLEAGTVGTVAKTIISALKAIPGINIGASLLNAIIAGIIVASLGETSLIVMEKIYKGEASAADVDWVNRLLEKATKENVEKYIKILEEKLPKVKDINDVKNILMEMFGK